MRYIAKQRTASNYQDYGFSFEMVDTSFEEMEISEYLTQKKTVLSRSVRASMEDGLLSKIGAFFKKIIGFFTGIFKKIFGFSKQAKAVATEMKEDRFITKANKTSETWDRVTTSLSSLPFVTEEETTIDNVDKEFDQVVQVINLYRIVLLQAKKRTTDSFIGGGQKGENFYQLYGQKLTTDGPKSTFSVSKLESEGTHFIFPVVKLSPQRDFKTITINSQTKDFRKVAKKLDDIVSTLKDLEKLIDLSLKDIKDLEKTALTNFDKETSAEQKALFSKRLMEISKQYNGVTSITSSLIMSVLKLLMVYKNAIDKEDKSTDKKEES